MKTSTTGLIRGIACGFAALFISTSNTPSLAQDTATKPDPKATAEAMPSPQERCIHFQTLCCWKVLCSSRKYCSEVDGEGGERPEEDEGGGTLPRQHAVPQRGSSFPLAK